MSLAIAFGVVFPIGAGLVEASTTAFWAKQQELALFDDYELQSLPDWAIDDLQAERRRDNGVKTAWWTKVLRFTNKFGGEKQSTRPAKLSPIF